MYEHAIIFTTFNVDEINVYKSSLFTPLRLPTIYYQFIHNVVIFASDADTPSEINQEGEERALTETEEVSQQ